MCLNAWTAAGDNRPLVLPCSHSLCEGCQRTLPFSTPHREGGSEELYKCPLCVGMGAGLPKPNYAFIEYLVAQAQAASKTQVQARELAQAQAAGHLQDLKATEAQL